MNVITGAIVCGLCYIAFWDSCRAEDSGLSRKVYDDGEVRAVFTFRDDVLIHEISVVFEGEPETASRPSYGEFGENFLPWIIKSGHRTEWIERFYADKKLVFARIGTFDDSKPPLRLSPPRLVCEKFTGGTPAFVAQSACNENTHSRILFVGGEAFDLGEDGFYHVWKMRDGVLKSSVRFDAEFFTPALNRERRKYLAEPLEGAVLKGSYLDQPTPLPKSIQNR